LIYIGVLLPDNNKVNKTKKPMQIKQIDFARLLYFIRLFLANPLPQRCLVLVAQCNSFPKADSVLNKVAIGLASESA
jgi:hypothetical protein